MNGLRLAVPLVLVSLGACGGTPAPDPDPVPEATAPAADENAWFVDVAAQRGIDFLHQDGRSGRGYFIETATPGAGWIDFDRDGDLDIYLINGARTPGSTLAEDPRNKLYENRDGRFVDVSERAGVADTEFGIGHVRRRYRRRRLAGLPGHQLRTGPAVPQPRRRPFRAGGRSRRCRRFRIQQRLRLRRSGRRL